MQKYKDIRRARLHLCGRHTHQGCRFKETMVRILVSLEGVFVARFTTDKLSKSAKMFLREPENVRVLCVCVCVCEGCCHGNSNRDNSRCVQGSGPLEPVEPLQMTSEGPPWMCVVGAWIRQHRASPDAAATGLRSG